MLKEEKKEDFDSWLRAKAWHKIGKIDWTAC